MEGERQRGKGVKQNLTVSTLYRGIAKAMNIITIRWLVLSMCYHAHVN